MRILVADDARFEREFVEKLVLKIFPEAEVILVETGEKALESIGSQIPDIFICDQNFGFTMEGTEVIATLRYNISDQLREIPCILYSSMAHAKFRRLRWGDEITRAAGSLDELKKILLDFHGKIRN